MQPVPIELKFLHPEAKFEKSTEGSAGYDLYALNCAEASTIYPGQTVIIGTGIAISISSKEVAAEVVGRSGLGFSQNIRLANCVGIIDSDFRGEIKLALYNDGFRQYTVCRGDKIGQLLFKLLAPVSLFKVASFSTETERGENGFGSTGR